MTGAAAITVFHPGVDPQAFDAWARGLLASAASAAGHTDSRISVHDETGLDWAVEVTFDTAAQLDEWLDSPQRRRLLADGEKLGFSCSSGDLVLAENGIPPEGVALFVHNVAPGKEGDFVARQAVIAADTDAFPGNQGTIVFPSDPSTDWTSVVRFRTAHQLDGWLHSSEREKALPALRAILTRNFSEVARSAPFGSTVRTDFGETRITPAWRTAMLVLCCLYPTVMLLSRFVTPVATRLGLPFWLTLFLSNAVSIALLQWVLVPALSRPFRRWLDPVDGAGARVAMAGAALIVLGYAALLLLFASVRQLQFWN
jgi:antibiotic biosynthesis monooxygenase (ABM) superfamily enzyme